MQARYFGSIVAAAGFLFCSYSRDAGQVGALSPPQQLVVAAFNLEVERVKELIEQGIDVDSRMGEHDEKQFYDKWSLGWPVASNMWTPLLAVANSHREPQPEQETKNTSEDLNKALEERSKIDPVVIAERDQRRVAIAKLLITARANLDLDDGHGATALYDAIYEGYDDLALLLIESGAKVNTKTGVYIDGADAITPLHRATRSSRIVKALLEHGAKIDRDSKGTTALHWAAMDENAECVRLLLAAGADPNTQDEEGRTALYWVASEPPSIHGIMNMTPELAEIFRKEFAKYEKKKEVADLLRQAGAR